MIYRFHSTTGGWRFVVIFHDGRKHVRLLDISTLEVHTIPAAEKRGLVFYGGKGTNIAKRLRATARTYKRCEVGFPRASVKKAIQVLEGGV